MHRLLTSRLFDGSSESLRRAVCIELLYPKEKNVLEFMVNPKLSVEENQAMRKYTKLEKKDELIYIYSIKNGFLNIEIASIGTVANIGMKSMVRGLRHKEDRIGVIEESQVRVIWKGFGRSWEAYGEDAYGLDNRMMIHDLYIGKEKGLIGGEGFALIDFVAQRDISQVSMRLKAMCVMSIDKIENNSYVMGHRNGSVSRWDERARFKNSRRRPKHISACKSIFAVDNIVITGHYDGSMFARDVRKSIDNDNIVRSYGELKCRQQVSNIAVDKEKGYFVVSYLDDQKHLRFEFFEFHNPNCIRCINSLIKRDFIPSYGLDILSDIYDSTAVISWGEGESHILLSSFTT